MKPDKEYLDLLSCLSSAILNLNVRPGWGQYWTRGQGWSQIWGQIIWDPKSKYQDCLPGKVSETY